MKQPINIPYKIKKINDLVGYEKLIQYMALNNTCNLPGDLLEIGCFMGGGSAKLAHFCKDFNKKLIAVDIFNPDFDKTIDKNNVALNDLYNAYLGNKSQKEVFDNNTKDEDNITLYITDSAKLKLDNNQELCFSFIDGNHTPEYVKNDFEFAWSHTVSGGIISFDDYCGQLPLVTKTIDELLSKYSSQISFIYKMPDYKIIFIHKK